MNKLKSFDQQYIDAKNRLITMQDDDLMGPIVEWFLNTQANPYSWLDPDYIDSQYNIFGSIDILCNIRHALEDDGEMCFPVTLDGDQKIFFMHSGNYIALHGEPIKFANDIYEFILNVESQHIDTIMHSFIFAAAGDTVENATIEYTKLYKDFDPSWANNVVVIKHIKSREKLRKRLKEFKDKKDANNVHK